VGGDILFNFLKNQDLPDVILTVWEFSSKNIGGGDGEEGNSLAITTVALVGCGLGASLNTGRKGREMLLPQVAISPSRLHDRFVGSRRRGGRVYFEPELIDLIGGPGNYATWRIRWREGEGSSHNTRGGGV